MNLLEIFFCRRVVVSLTVASMALAVCVGAAAQSSPSVHLDAEGLAPRPIEQLTGTAIVRAYTLAWQDLARTLESGRTERLGDNFVGFAKDRLLRRLQEQSKTGLHVRISDRGHSLKGIFYSTDGTAMQLVDHAQLEIQMFDGDKLIDSQTEPHDYVVLMTPGADRWYVRDLEEVSPKSF